MRPGRHLWTVLFSPAGDVYVLHGADGRRQPAIRAVELDTLHECADFRRLTKRERQISGLLAARATNEEIARKFGISPHTARHHTERVLKKLGLRTRAAVRTHIVDVIARTLPGAHAAG